MDEKLLFSEGQVKVLVDARTAQYIAEQQLADNPPKTITIQREKMIKKLEETEKQIWDKHKDAVTAWKKAYKAYGLYLSKHPGAQAMQAPGFKPEVPGQVEDIRAWIRALEITDAKEIKMSVEQWIMVFKNAGQAISDMRIKRSQYLTNYALASGAMTYAGSLSTTSTG